MVLRCVGTGFDRLTCWVRIVAQIQRVSARSLSTETANLKGAAAAPSVAVEKIKYFKIYRWDPEQNQKPYLVRGQKVYTPTPELLYFTWCHSTDGPMFSPTQSSSSSSSTTNTYIRIRVVHVPRQFERLRAHGLGCPHQDQE